MKLTMRLTALALAAMLLLCGCGAPAESDPDYSRLIVAPVDLSITGCITEQQLSTIMGCGMTLLGTYEEDTQAIYTASDDSGSMVTINLKNQSRAGFDAVIAGYGTDVTLYEGVGEAAFWSNVTNELLVYANEYALGVAVSCADTTMIEAYTRQVADIVVKSLQPQQ
jgi:hypothetical protein